MDFLARMGLLDYEAAPEGDGPAPPEPAPEPTPEPAPEPTPEGEPAAEWAGVSQEEWQQTQSALGSALEFINSLQQPYYPDPEPQQQELPAYDPYDPEAAQAYFDAREERLLNAIDQRLAPVTEHYQNDSATQWAEDTFSRLGVPEDAHWRDGVLFASAGFQQFDEYGRPLVHPQQAAAQGYQFLRAFAEAERAAERELLKQQGAAVDETLRNRANSPDLPAGPAGAEGTPEGIDELQAARIWRERQGDF